MKIKLVKESLNEFHKGEDPLGSLGIGIANPKTKAHKILLFIWSKGEEGASLTQIQHFIWTNLFKLSEDSFWEKDETGSRKSRGTYGVNLYSHRLLYNWCRRNEKGKWVLDRYPKPGENVY